MFIENLVHIFEESGETLVDVDVVELFYFLCVLSLPLFLDNFG